MKKIYTSELDYKQLNPKKSTISFLLNYSKSIKVEKNKIDKPVLFNMN